MGIRSASTIQGFQQELGANLSGAIGGVSGDLLDVIFGDESIESITRDFTEQFATPVMQIWQREIAPLIREQFAGVPGAAFSLASGRGLQKSGEDFLATRIAPQLFSALESFRNRGVQRANISGSVLGIGAGLSTAPTVQSFMKPPKEKGDEGGAIGAGAGAIGGFILGGPAGAQGGAQLGALIGGQF